GTAVFVADFVAQDFMKYAGDFSFDAVLLKLAANLIQGATAALGQRDRGALQFFVVAFDFFRGDLYRAVQETRITLGKVCPHPSELTIFRQPCEIARSDFLPGDF